MREVTTTEPFLEAWPSIIIMTIIWLYAINDRSFSNHCLYEAGYNSTIRDYNDNECNEYLHSNFQPPIYCTNHPENNRCAVYGGFGGMPWFFTTYSISIITGALGITKFLQVGSFSVLTSEGALSGICKCRFFLAFMAVMTSMATNGVFIGIFFYILSTNGLWQRSLQKSLLEPLGVSGLESEESRTEARIILLLILGGLLILPNLLLSWISIGCSTGFNKKLIQVILAYPAAWMLPITTYFVIGPQKSCCCTKTDTDRYHLGFSKSYTIINIIITIMMYAFILIFIGYRLAIYFGPVLFLSLVFNIAFMLSDLECCCSCCCNNECRSHETYVIATNTLELDIVKIEE